MLQPKLPDQRVLAQLRIGRSLSYSCYVGKRFVQILPVNETLIFTEYKRSYVPVKLVTRTEHKCKGRVVQVLQVHDVA